jgi:flagellar biosynthesis protein FlhF
LERKRGREQGAELKTEEDLLAFGLSAAHARLITQHGLEAREVLMRAWRPIPKSAAQLHVFVGASGVGKTTVLCKWLAQVVLLGGESARVWRLDGRSANTAESLAIYAEILSVPVERSWNSPSHEMDIGFVDLPGIDWRDESALKDLSRLLDTLGEAQVHLVLNAAYESSILLQQIEAFSALPISDLIITHLDEESRWGKLWNLVLGSSQSLRFLSVGQNVPGTFQIAAPEHLL